MESNSYIKKIKLKVLVREKAAVTYRRDLSYASHTIMSQRVAQESEVQKVRTWLPALYASGQGL